MLKKIFNDLYQIKPGKLSSQCYLIISDRNILIDSGTSDDFPEFERNLDDIGLKLKDIDIVINTHEHFDHIGGNLFLQNTSIVMAHRFSAVKMIYGDDEIMMCRAHGENIKGYRVNTWLNNTDVIEINGWFLKILHTPGHTSGCISLYEPRKRILFSGDGLFANGTLSTIFKSGSLGEYVNSLKRIQTMKIDLLLPGHGTISKNANDDIEKSIKNALEKFSKIGGVK